MHILKRTSYLWIAMIFGGCATPHVLVNMLNAPASYSPVPACEVYHDSFGIPYKFFRIGCIRGEQETTVSDAAQLQNVAKSLLRDMTKAASPEGADGIIAIVVADHPHSGFVTDYGVTALKHTLSARGTLIRFERDNDGNPIQR